LKLSWRSGIKRWTTRAGWSDTIARAPRLEFEQARLRVGIGGLVLVGLMWRHVFLTGPRTELLHMIWFLGGFVTFAVAITIWILSRPHESHLRRILGVIADNAGTTYFMLHMGEWGALVVGIYLFVAFGNSYRYGRIYLRISHGLALAGFSLVLFFSDFWSQHLLTIGAGMFIALAVLPLYVGFLSERLQEEKNRADEANASKDRFLANVSHEMRTPLNGVIAMADLLRETSMNESQREIVQTLGTSAQLALAQIEDVLDMAKLQAGRVNIETRPFDFGRFITETVKVILPQARYKKLAVNTNVADEAARWFIGDSHHLRQVLLNLLSNAVKFTERGAVSLSARVVNTVDAVSMMRIEVRDTGIGIDPSKQAEIFEPFAQADDSITRVYGGTGLGTTIARQLVGLMGGTIGLESQLGQGSVFWLEIPLPHSVPQGIDLVEELAASVKLSSSGARPGGHEASVHKMRGARILVAEDNPTNQRVTRLILESGGHIATIVKNGEEALDALENGSFHLALFDMSMPGVSGLEALKLYQFTAPKPIPVLMLSANVTTEAIAQCQAAGAAEFIPKPVRPSALLDAIERHLAVEAETLVAPPVRTEERPALAVVDIPVLDQGVLSDLAQISSDPTFVDRLIRGFHSDSERLVAEVCDALAHRRYESAKDSAHALKGGAGSVGASQLTQFSVRLEKATHETLRLKASQWADELVRTATRTYAALEEHLESRRKSQSSSS
jgi:two-component system, sensor histidine kinase RpfC